MAEVIGVAASVIGIVAVGAKLSTTLYTYAKTVFTADQRLKHIAKDIPLTSQVHSQSGACLEQDAGANICTANAIQVPREALDRCEKMFGEIEDAISEAVKRDEAGKAVFTTSTRLRWPLKEQKMSLLGANLDRLKSTLNLMLNVLLHARAMTSEYANSNVLRLVP